MLLKQAAAAEFEWLKQDELKHAPTNATFLIRRNAIEALSIGLMAYRLDDGGDYDTESVLDLAWKIAEQRMLDRKGE